MGSKRHPSRVHQPNRSSRPSSAGLSIAHSNRLRLLELGLGHHRAGRRQEALAAYQQVITSHPADFEANLFLGTLYLEGQAGERAVAHLERAVKAQPDDPRALRYLALAFEQVGRFDRAIDAFEKGCVQSPLSADLRVQFGRCLLASKQLGRAEKLFQEAIGIDPLRADAWHGLGDVGRLTGMFDEAIKLYRHAIELDGSSYATVMNLAFLLQAEGFDAEAADQFARGMLLAPSMIEPAAGRAVSLARLGETKEAMALAADLYQRSPTHPRVHECLANLYEQQGRWAQAMEAWKEAVRLQPDSIRYRRTLAQRLLDGGARAEAADLCRQVLVDHPDDQPGAMMLASIEEQADCVVAARSIYQRLAKTGGDEALWKLREACAVPTILTEEGVIEECRQQIRDSLDQAAEADHCRSLDHLAAIGVMPPFNLAFHHRDDRALREKFAAWTSRLMGIEPSNGPQRSTRARPRIGFFCSGNPQAFCRSLHGILTRMDSGKLEAMVVTLPLIEPTLSQVFRGTSIPIVPLPSEPRRMIEAIRSMDLDLLIYFEVGTSPIGYLLAQHRLARVQVATWGIQITTGIASIDYYLSSDALEVEDSQKQYSEQLVRGRSLLTVMRRLPRWAGRIDRDQLGLPASGSIYLCPQQLGKFTPRFDLVLSQILRQDVTGYVVITEGNIPELTSRLRERWRRTISDVSDRIVFVPQAQGESYLALIAASDVVLDPIDFGGVNTTYDVFSQNKVLVTLPSCFQRTRYAAACYGRMGIDEAIATSIDDYVAKAVHFATVSDARQSLEKRLRERTDGIFMQVDAAADVERILLALAHGDGPW